MFKVEIKNLEKDKITHGAKWETMDEVNAWIAKIESIKTTDGSNPWGFKERVILKSTATTWELANALEEIAEEIETTREERTIVSKEDDGTETIKIKPAKTKVIRPAMIRVPQTYEIIIKDITEKEDEEKLKEREKEELRNMLKELNESDMDTVAKLKGVVKKLIKVLL
jgi:hypothetical protein